MLLCTFYFFVIAFYFRLHFKSVCNHLLKSFIIAALKSITAYSNISVILESASVVFSQVS